MNKKMYISPKSQNILGDNDEGLHYKKFYKTTEWWYYNALFNDPNSELRNWFIAISFNSFPELESLKLIIHDDKSKNYGGICLKPKGTLQTSGNGVNV